MILEGTDNVLELVPEMLPALGAALSPTTALAPLDVSDGDFTVEATVRLGVAPDPTCGFQFLRWIVGWDLRGMSSPAAQGFVLGTTVSTAQATFVLRGEDAGATGNGTIAVVLTGGPSLFDQAEHTLVAIRNGDAVQLFVDGTCVAQADLPPDLGTTSPEGASSMMIQDRFTVGGRRVSATGCSVNDDFIGHIDDVRLFDVAILDPLNTVVPGCAVAAVHSGGTSAKLGIRGPLPFGTGPLWLELRDAPADVNGLFAVSATPLASPVPLQGSQGLLCLGAGLQRVSLPGTGPFVFDTGSAGSASFDLGNASFLGVPAPAAGTTLYFQAWFRDVDSGMPTSNMSNAVGATF